MKIGNYVFVAFDNDNETYDDFRDKMLRITDAFYSTDDHPGYDDSMEGMGLFELETSEGEPIYYLLYEYELELA